MGTSPIVQMRKVRPRANVGRSTKVPQLRDACLPDQFCLKLTSERHQDRWRESVNKRDEEEGDLLTVLTSGHRAMTATGVRG